jgi:hypothetical protein
MQIGNRPSKLLGHYFELKPLYFKIIGIAHKPSHTHYADLAQFVNFWTVT